MMLPFLAAKTRVPPTPPNLVTRSHLLEAMDQCLQPGVQLALVSAPAGAGKTTLLAQWLRRAQADWKVAWFALDTDDNHLGRFFSYLAAAIEYAIPDFGGNFTALAEANPNFTPDQGIAYLVEQVVDAEQNLLLVFDDYHAITEPEIHQALKLLIDHLPNNMRLIIAGRVEPPLPLARLRARGQLVEVRTADLRFSVQETSDFMGCFGELASFAKQETYLQQLNASTEGWAAGVQLTALALRSEVTHHGGATAALMERFVRELSGSQRFILDYLLEEVLSRETDRTRFFLLHTCLLKRFNSALCAAVMTDTTATAAQEMLDYLERANLFLIPLDDGQDWFRYHHLFADVLQKQLLHSHPGLAPELHRRAANWFDGQGMVDEALEHAQSSGDANLALDLVEKHALEAILQGQIATATRWLDMLPAEALLARPRLCLNRAWALTFTSQTEAAVPYLARAADLSSEMPSAQAEILGLQSYGKSVYGLTGEAVRLAELGLEISPVDDAFLQCINHLFLASALVRDGKLDEAMQTYHSVRTACQGQHNLAGLALLEVDFLQYAAVFMNARNQAQQARDMLQDAIKNFEAAGGNRKSATLYLHVGLGKILFIGNQLAEAERALEMGLQLDPLSLSLAAIDGWLTLWWVKIGQGDYPAARRILNDLTPSLRQRDEKILRLFILTSALQDLLEGMTASAVGRMERLGFSDDVDSALEKVSDSELIGWRSNEFLVYARVLAAQGKTALSLRVLARMAQVTREHRLYWIMYRTWITQAMVYFQDHQIDSALEIMARLLEQTARLDSGAVRVYLSAGEPARALLNEAIRRGIQPAHAARLLAEFPPVAAVLKPSDLPEMLTERELDVLRLMAAGLKNQEIGEKLYISLNTIRYHTSNIFGKLGVDHRSAAVARARELNILA